MRIALDAMGGDHAPQETVKGAVEFVRHRAYSNHKVVLVGEPAALETELRKYSYDSQRIDLVAASQVVAMDEKPARIVKTKPDSSLVKAVTLVRDKQVDGIVSAGSTGALLAAGLPVWSIQPGATLRCADGHVTAGPDETVRLALERGLIPLVYGDVALDTVRGGTIASTEEIFDWLARVLPPRRIVRAGEVDGVYTADPLRFPSAQPLQEITPATLTSLSAGLGASHGTDVTGGMAAKISQALAMARRQPGLEVIICGGLRPGHVERALAGGEDWPGTRVVADK